MPKNQPPSQGKYQVPSDKFYSDHGVQGPERISLGNEDAIMEQIKNMEGRTHGPWRQQGVGGYIECLGCDNVHGHAVKSDDMLMGTDGNGMPILKKLAL